MNKIKAINKKYYNYVGNEKMAERYGLGLPPKLPHEVWEDRINRSKKLIQERGLDALLIYSGGNRREGREWLRYFSNAVFHAPGWSCQAFIFIPLDGDPTLFVNFPFIVPSDFNPVEEASLIKDIRRFVHFTGPTNLETLRSFFKEKKFEKGRIGFASMGIGGINPFLIDAEKELKKSGMNFIEASDILFDLVSFKTDYDVRMVEKAGKVVCECMKAALETLGEGVREFEVAIACIKASYERNAELQDFGDSRLYIGGTPGIEQLCDRPFFVTNRQFRKGDSVFLDVGLVYQGYQADIARMACIGPPSEHLVRLHETGLRMHKSCIAALKPGVKAGALYDIMRDICEEAGCIPYGVLGHGIGILENEPPFIAPGVPTVIKKGMIMNLETINLKHKVGVGGTEDAYFVTDGKPQWLTKMSQDLFIA